MNNKERRISKRVPAKFEVNYVHDGDYIISHSKDISTDGMFLYTKSPAQNDETATLTFSVADMQNVEISARVIWVNKKGTNNTDKDAGMALEFVDPSKELQEMILKLINRVAVLEM